MLASSELATKTTAIMTFQTKRRTAVARATASLLLLVSVSTHEAFTPTPLPLARGNAPERRPTAISIALDDVAEVREPPPPLFATTSSSDAAISPELLVASSSSELSSLSPATILVVGDGPVAAPTIQSRSLDGDTIINASILIFAIVIVLERILSVDVGITRAWSPAEIAERIPLDNWRSYTDVLNMAPLRTKAITSATVYAIGDVLSQLKEEEGTEGTGGGGGIGRIDRWRTLRSSVAGLVGHGPMSHVWYHVSEDFFENVLNLHAWWDFVPKVVVDQAIFGPIWNNTYILLLGLMQLQGPTRIWDDMKRTTVPLILSGLKLWPFVHCITYGLIPVENRLLWVDAVEIVWVTILAGEASSSSSSGDDTPVEVEATEEDGTSTFNGGGKDSIR